MKQKLFNLFLSLVMATQFCGFGAVYAEDTSESTIVVNGGFEDGTDGWSGDATLFSVDTTEKRSGNASLKVSVDDAKKKAWQKVTQTVNVTVGKTYALSFYSKFVSGKGVQHIDSNRITYVVPEDEWTKHTTVFTAQNDTVAIGFGNYYGETAEFYMDDIEITEVDAQATPETVLNGDFENPVDGLGWNMSGSAIFGISKSEKYSGAQSLMLKVAAEQNKTDSYSNYSQNVKVNPGQEYQLGFFSKNVSGKAIVKLTYGKDESGKDKKIEKFLNTQTEWIQNTIDFTAESDSVKIEITNNKGDYDAEIYFDDFFIIRKNSDKIENAGFEGGMLGWSGYTTLFSADTTEKRTGNISLKINITDENKKAWNKVAQTVNVTAGKTYALSFYSKFVSGNGVHHIGNLQYTHTVPEQEWTKHTTVFTAQSDTVTIAFGNYYGETTQFFVDDIELVEVNFERKAETIINGDFENDTDNLGWECSGDCFNISTSEKFTGNKSMRVKVESEQNKSYSTYSQNVNVVAGKAYQLKFYCKNVAGKTMVKIEYGKDDAGKAKVVQTNITTTGDWKEYVVNFTPELETVKVFIQNYAGAYDNELYFDDFELVRRENLSISNKSKEFSNGILKVNATIEKINYEKTSADIIVAMYDESGRLLDVKIQKADFSSQNTYDVSADFEAEEGKAYNVVLYTWDSVGNMNPTVPSESF